MLANNLSICSEPTGKLWPLDFANSCNQVWLNLRANLLFISGTTPSALMKILYIRKKSLEQASKRVGASIVKQ